MPRPKFTEQEEYLLNGIRARHTSDGSEYMWGSLITAVVFAAFAVYYDSYLLAVSGLVVVCGTRIYEERYQSKWKPVFPSIVEKYEQAIAQADGQRLDGPNSN